MKTVLIATDGSESGRAAVETGLEFAADEAARAVIARVTSFAEFGMSWDAPLDNPPQRMPQPEDDAVLAEALLLAAERGVAAKAELLVGYPAKQIVRLANEIDADVIVVGSRPLGRLTRAIVGSTSRVILELTGRPVLIVNDSSVREPVPTP